MLIFQRLWQGVTRLRGLILPVFAKARDVRSVGRTVIWAMHLTLLIAVLVGLGFLNQALDLEKLLEAPLPLLKKIWLPFLFFIVYLLTWLGWWLWVLLGAEEERSIYPDIDRAWEQAVAALEAAGIQMAEVPIFLVLGQPEGTEQALFAGSQLELSIESVPKDFGAPLHVYASPDAVFLTCAGASLLGRQAQKLMEEEAPPPLPKSAPVTDSQVLSSPSVNLPPVDPATGAPALAGGSQVKAPESVQLTMESQLLVAEKEPSTRMKPARLPLLKNTEEVMRLASRLKHLCWLILRERRPYCPVNGILLLIPYAATDSDAEANQTGLVCQKDLQALRDVLQINCPLFALVCDMENATGFREFIDRFPKGHRQRRLGQQFPYVADLNPTSGGQLIDSGVQWICQELFPPLIYRLMRLEKAGQDKLSPTLRGNMNLYELLCEMRGRRQRLGRILAQAIDSEAAEPILFGGCYLAATGRSSREQAFIAAVFHRLLENQNFVSWTEASRAEEADFRRWVRYGYTAIAIFTVVLFAMGFAFISRR